LDAKAKFYMYVVVIFEKLKFKMVTWLFCSFFVLVRKCFILTDLKVRQSNLLEALKPDIKEEKEIAHFTTIEAICTCKTVL
jgi:hypothetical protein